MQAKQQEGENRDSGRKLEIDFFGHTDIGSVRATNDDTYLCRTLSGNGTRKVLLAVADGMGGHLGGDTASRLAVETLGEVVIEHADDPVDEKRSTSDLLRYAIREASGTIHRESRENLHLRGMGTTVVVGLIVEDHLTLANVGDSRAYLVRGGQCHQVTEDHSWIAEQLKRGTLSEEQMNASPFRNSITRSLGVDPDVEVDIFGFDLEVKDGIFLCTDGLYRSLGTEEIADAFQVLPDAEAVCRRLLEEAKRRDGSDNLTAVVVRCLGETSASAMRSPSETQPVDLEAFRKRRAD